ncbi:gp37 [Burkholderia phage BcepC6B]|uniref:Gp37 n=1 Tax=Burkholderia phage BcepC6B TaxID=2883949 RepID=Q6J1P0_9CAUD|nr:hypothetical protein BcepC6B_gp37 [Burkholderia phage BcepC6B]AAT38396.1 gp37 [Burkholderia phage BcepC6B]
MRKPRALKSDSGKIGTPDIRTTYQEIDVNQINVVVYGPVGSGKSALCGEIEILCRALGVTAHWKNGDEEKRLTHADWTSALEMYKPHVEITERIERDTAPVLTDAARDVLAERRRQVDVEGFTPEHDDQYGDGALSAAAGSYALHAFDRRADLTPAWWPWVRAWWKPGTPRQMLVKAGALILAAIEQIDRRATKNQSGA